VTTPKSNERAATLRARGLRVEDPTTATPVTYDPGSGQPPRAWPGDEASPFVAVPATFDAPTLTYSSSAANLAGPVVYPADSVTWGDLIGGVGTVLADLDVTGFRLLTFFIELRVRLPSFFPLPSTIAIFPTARLPVHGRLGTSTEDDSEVSYFSVPVIDPTVRTSLYTNSGVSIDPLVGARNVFPAQLTLPIRNASVEQRTEVMTYTLPFDVSYIEHFTLFGLPFNDGRNDLELPTPPSNLPIIDDASGVTNTNLMRVFAQLSR